MAPGSRTDSRTSEFLLFAHPVAGLQVLAKVPELGTFRRDVAEKLSRSVLEVGGAGIEPAIADSSSAALPTTPLLSA